MVAEPNMTAELARTDEIFTSDRFWGLRNMQRCATGGNPQQMKVSSDRPPHPHEHMKYGNKRATRTRRNVNAATAEILDMFKLCLVELVLADR
jgi:hypothetical protein